MDIKTYVKKYRSEGGSLADLAKRAGMSQMYLRHLMNGHKDNPRIETIIKLVIASDGAITLRALRPDIFSGPKGKKARDLLKRAAV